MKTKKATCNLPPMTKYDPTCLLRQLEAAVFAQQDAWIAFVELKTSVLHHEPVSGSRQDIGDAISRFVYVRADGSKVGEKDLKNFYSTALGLSAIHGDKKQMLLLLKQAVLAEEVAIVTGVYLMKVTPHKESDDFKRRYSAVAEFVAELALKDDGARKKLTPADLEAYLKATSATSLTGATSVIQ
jgi:hypothetical protein